jgi:alpha-acetolactate decarboxylase
MINPLEPRNAFYGGRTEAFTLFQKDQDISYVDVTSLYPYINKTGKIPIGHPEIVTEGFTAMIFLSRYVDRVSVDGFHFMFYTE